MSKVYLLKTTDKTPEAMEKAGNKISKLFSDVFSADDKVAIKLHFGERGSKTYLNPNFTKGVYDSLKEKVKEAVLTDCTVLYKGNRSFASSHKKLAKDQGFGFAPIVIADGEKGREEIKIEVNQKHFKFVRLGAALKEFNCILALTHFTGHGMAGIGGALKNIGMGFGTKGGKMDMHQHFDLEINQELCTGCGACARECAGGAITIENGKARIDKNKCLSCALCISLCPVGAVQRPFGAESAGTARDLQERIVEYALGALRGKKSYFVNVLMDVTPHCDCLSSGFREPIVKDIGILASDDIVAIDQASLDLTGKEHFEAADMNPSDQIDYAEKLGLGEKKYDLIEID